MDIRLRGPAGVRARMEELQARLERLSPPSAGTASGAVQAYAEDEHPLSGPIGNPFAPVSPVGPGTRLEPSEQIRTLIQRAAATHNVDPRLLEALVAEESRFDPSARSRAGALGLTQLMPNTAAQLGVQNPFDPEQSLNGGARYLAEMLQKYGGDLETALAAYNAGPGTVARFGGVPPYGETQRYIQRVMARYRAGGVP